MPSCAGAQVYRLLTALAIGTGTASGGTRGEPLALVGVRRGDRHRGDHVVRDAHGECSHLSRGAHRGALSATATAPYTACLAAGKDCE